MLPGCSGCLEKAGIAFFQESFEKSTEKWSRTVKIFCDRENSYAAKQYSL